MCTLYTDRPLSFTQIWERFSRVAVLLLLSLLFVRCRKYNTVFPSIQILVYSIRFDLLTPTVISRRDSIAPSIIGTVNKHQP